MPSSMVKNVAFSGFVLLVQSVSDGGCGGLVNNMENGMTSDDTRVLGGLPLRVVEVGGDGDDGSTSSLGLDSEKICLSWVSALFPLDELGN